ncbi:MAG: cytochrome c-type biosis protein CcmH [Nocardioidaceae bacterium]|nr:cytochrome c-type biosis protein CcmH [Nocardioidaceae bacterium]
MSARPTTRSLIVLAALVVAVVSMLAVAVSGRGASMTRAQQAHAIAATLRCPVCKDLSAADSPAPLARQMRAQIRQQLAKGATPEAIRSGFVSAYGSSVLMSPPDRGWGRAARWAPVALLACALLAGGRLVRRGLKAPHDPGADTPSGRLRQLRDLEDDHAAGRISQDDYLEVRAGLESAAAASDGADHPVASARSKDRPAPRSQRPAPRPHHPARWALGVAAASVAATCVGALLVGALGPRGPQAAGAAVPSAQPAGTGGRQPSRASSGAGAVSGAELAAVESAVKEVQGDPGRAAAHVDLARAYTDAHQPQLAAVEYVAATRLDPGNAQANTALALVAFQAGNPKQADALVTRALRRHPDYPEALYTRGLIRAMGLHRPRAAAQDLRAYQRAAPRGSHVTTVATVLALLASGAVR